MGVGRVSGTGDSVTEGSGVSVDVGRLVAEGLGGGVSVGTGAVVGGREVEDGVTTIGVGGSVGGVVRLTNEGLVFCP
jgi:hypothetical protein